MLSARPLALTLVLLLSTLGTFVITALVLKLALRWQQGRGHD
jgi:putative effector of murein hydrolase LrgA (UPF0299 family)